MNKWILRGLIVIAIVSIGTVAGYLFVINSPSYKLASSYAMTSSRVREITGTVRQTGLDIFGSNLSESEESGDANLTINVHGDKSDIKLVVALTKYAGVWHIDSAGMNGVPIFPD
jgi:hypothetical protein